jgi:predicted DsbA family dithiol-disulfide isomerase
VRWHGFRLPRATGASAVSAWHAHLAARLPPQVEPKLAERGLIEAGLELGIQFDFARIGAVPDTTAAHRLTLIAARDNRLAAVVDGVFRAYFEHGRDIGDCSVLTEIAHAAGLSERSLQEFAGSDAARDELETEESRLRGLGVSNVPNLLFNGHVLVPGVADVDTYVLALDQALFPSSGESPQRPRLLN